MHPLITLILFYTSIITLSICALRIDSKNHLRPFGGDSSRGAPRASEMRQVSYFIEKLYKPHLFLKAKLIQQQENENLVLLVAPQGNAYKDDGTFVNYKAKRGKILDKEKKLFLYEDVWLFDDNTTVRSKEASYSANNDFFTLVGPLTSEHLDSASKDHIFISALRGEGYVKKQTGHYEGQVKGKIVRQRRYEPPTDFEGDFLEYLGPKSQIILKGRVGIYREKMKAFAKRGEIFLNNYSKKLKYYALYDDVKIFETLLDKKGQPMQREAYSEKLAGHAQTGKVILTGYPRLIQGSDTIKGNVITFYEKSDLVEVDDAHSRLTVKQGE